jgi:hypothetical protein
MAIKIIMGKIAIDGTTLLVQRGKKLESIKTNISQKL